MIMNPSSEKLKDITGESFPIREATEICRQYLHECANRASLQKAHWADNRASDFNLWDSGIGACANEMYCLDKRLERNTPARDMVISTLRTLAAWTMKCREVAEAVEATVESPGHESISINKHSPDPPDGINLDEAKNAVEVLLKILVDLEIAIRRAGTASRLRRADRSFPTRRQNYAELSEHLEFILRVSEASRRENNPASLPTMSANISDIVIAPVPNHSNRYGLVDQSSTPFRTDEIDVSSAILQLQGQRGPLRPEQQVLVLANIKRADRFEFFRTRRLRLFRFETARGSSQFPTRTKSTQYNQPPDAPIEHDIQPVQSMEPMRSLPDLNNEHVIQTRSEHSKGTTDRVSDFEPASSLENAVKMSSPVVAPTTIALRADYPRPPKDKTRCPYCFIPFEITLQDSADGMRQWKKHASEDLQPYTCCLTDCDRKNPFFNTFDAWKTHILSDYHQKFKGWICIFCQYSAKPSQESIFLDHARTNHSDSLAEESLGSFMNMCRLHNTSALDICPVCSMYENDWKCRKENDSRFEPRVESFLEHIGQCMHYFSLRVLPDPDPVKSEYESDHDPTSISALEDRSFPSCYLHVSHQSEGLKSYNLDLFPELNCNDPVGKVERIQAWAESAEEMRNPNSLDETIRLDPRFDLSHKMASEDMPLGRSAVSICGIDGKEANKSHDLIYHIPYRRNHSFSGRETQIDDLLRMLYVDSRQQVAVIGLGGMGKTQIALELAYRIREKERCSVFWLSAQSLAAFQQAVIEVVKRLNLYVGDDNDVKEVFRLYLSSETAGHWLLVLNDFDDRPTLDDEPAQSGSLSAFLPRSKTGKTLITTRSPQIAEEIAGADVILLEAMGPEEAYRLFQKLLRQEVDSADFPTAMELLQQLTYLPLAITQAVLFINRNRLPISKYLELWMSATENMVALLSEQHHAEEQHHKMQSAIATTWIISFEDIRKRNAQAARLLSFFQWIDFIAIPVSILPDFGSPLDLMDSIGMFCFYGFTNWREDEETLDMHRLVHMALRLWSNQAQSGSGLMTREDAVSHISAIFPSSAWENRLIWRAYLPHVLPLIREGLSDQDTASVSLANKVGLCLDVDSRVRESLEIFKRVIAVREETLAENHPDRLDSQHNLAIAYKANGHIKKAIELLEHVVAIRDQVLAADHPDRLSSQHDLAKAYEANGQIKKAIMLLEHIVAVRDQGLAEDHPDRLSSQHDLAIAYKANGQIKEAVQLLKHVVAIRDLVLAEDHPDRLLSRRALESAQLTIGHRKAE